MVSYKGHHTLHVVFRWTHLHKSSDEVVTLAEDLHCFVVLRELRNLLQTEGENNNYSC